MLQVIEWIGLLHPMVVHFPIALLLAAALAEGLVIAGWAPGLAPGVRFCLWTGALGAVVAASLGWADAILLAGQSMGFMHSLLTWHRWLGTSTALGAVLTLVAYEVSGRRNGRGRFWYRLGLVLCVLLIAVTGHLGASLVYGWHYLKWPPSVM